MEKARLSANIEETINIQNRLLSSSGLTGIVYLEKDTLMGQCVVCNINSVAFVMAEDTIPHRIVDHLHTQYS